MRKFALVTDSVIDASPEFFSENDVQFAPLSFTLEGVGTVVDDLGKTVPYHEFYKALREGKNVSTSQANIEDFLKIYKVLLDAGQDIVYVGFSSGLSGSYNSGRIAAEEILPQYPDRKIYYIDTKAAAGGHGILARHIQEMRDAGATAQEAAEWLNDNSLKVSHWFTVDDLHYLQRGGRVSKTAAVMGSLIGIKPILYVDNEGKLIPFHKVRGRRQSLEFLGDKLCETIVSPETQTVRISHGDCFEDAEYLKQYIMERIPVKAIEIDMLDNVIGAHSGPGTIALFFMSDKRI